VTYLLVAAGVILAAVLLGIRQVFLVTTVDGSSMEPALRSGDRLLVRRARRARAGQVVVFDFAEEHKVKSRSARRSRYYLIKRAVAVPGDRVPAGWADPDLGAIAGTVVPSGSLVVLGDNRASSWDSRHYGFVGPGLFIGVVIRPLPGPFPDGPSRRSA
jgi:signal peptidase I